MSSCTYSPWHRVGHIVIASFYPSLTDLVVNHVENGNVALDTLFIYGKGHTD